MSTATYEASMSRVYADEGGYCDDKHDPGGATNLGVTIYDARLYAGEFGWIVGRAVTKDDMRQMPRWFADKVYRVKYANKIRYDDLPAGFDYSMQDAAINSGPGRAIPWGAKAIGDGLTGHDIASVVLGATVASDKVSLIQRYWSIRLSFLQSLANWKYFGKGWGRRCAQGEAAAVKMWLTFGASITPAATKATLDREAKKASTQSASAGKVAAGTATATTTASAPVATPAVDVAHLSLGGKIALACVAAAAIGIVFYYVRQSINHSQRATAYAAATGA